MEEDVAKALAYQVKKELAERYFGFRRLIEEDTANYFQAIEKTRHRFEEKMAREFVRLYVLLGDEDLIRRLVELLGLKRPWFLKRYHSLPPEAKRTIFRGLNPRGLTAKGRFKRLLFDTYERLYRLVEEYQKAFKELGVEAEVINEEIRQFKQKFDLSEIMQFLKSLEVSAEASLGHPDFQKSTTTLEKEMEMGKVLPPEELLPAIGPLPSPEKIRDHLWKLAQEAWRRHKDVVKELVKSACSNR